MRFQGDGQEIVLDGERFGMEMDVAHRFKLVHSVLFSHARQIGENDLLPSALATEIDPHLFPC